jgi:hypothetical protein
LVRKVVEVNLESGMPREEEAVRSMRNALLTHKRQGGRAVILIHGYGSSGVGGVIKAGVQKSLDGADLRGVVRTWVGGEQWPMRRREFIGMCKSLEEHDRSIAGNAGVTVVLLK